MYLSRRRFLKTSAAAATCGLATRLGATTARGNSIIDTHVYVGHWPLRRLSTQTPSELIAQLRRANVTQAWAGGFDGLFHKDVHGVNRRLAESCHNGRDGFLIPIGTVNPTLPDWEEDVRRCRKVFKMPGIRLHPSYHGYTLDDPRFARLLDLAAAAGLFVQIVAGMCDERQAYLTPRTSQVELGPLAHIGHTIDGLRLIIAGVKPAAVESIVALPGGSGAYFDFAPSANGKPLRKLIDRVSVDRIVCGSAAPLINGEPSILGLQKAGLNAAQVTAICSGNAKRFMSES